MAKKATLNFIFCICMACGFSSHVMADENTPFPDIWQMPTYIYEDYITAYERAFDEEAVPYWWAVGLSTAALLAVDDKLVVEANRIGRKLNISDGDTLKTYASYKGQAIFRAPTDLGSALYYIGDGWTHAAIAAGFLTVGAWSEDDKAYGIGFELMEGMITTTIATQFLKHITGHETPNTATKPKGRWDFFPNQRDYANCVPCYDAFPSGHVAVASMTLTVISKNYPDNPWVMPVGSTLIGLLAFQMMNNGVHWASDYPLAIALGYTFGSIAYERGEAALAQGQTDANAAQFLPLITNQGIGVAVNVQF